MSDKFPKLSPREFLDWYDAIIDTDSALWNDCPPALRGAVIRTINGSAEEWLLRELENLSEQGDGMRDQP